MGKSNGYKFSPKQGLKNSFGIRWFNIFVAVFWAFFIALALSNVLSPYFSQITKGLLAGMTPLLIGVVIAFITYRLVDGIESKLLKNAFKTSPYKFTLKRIISITLTLLVILGLITAFLAIMIPRVIDAIKELTVGGGDAWDQMVNKTVDEICELLRNWFGTDVTQSSVKEVFGGISTYVKNTIVYLGGVMQLSMSVVTAIFDFLIGFVIAVFILKDKEKISHFIRRMTYANLRKERADEMYVMAHNASTILYDYVICKLVEFVLLFVTHGVTFMCMGLKFTWELALIIAVFSLIPYFGIYIACVPVLLITIVFDSLNSALYVLLAIFIITTVLYNFVIPFITGKKLKISSLLVICSIILGGAMFGVIGMLLAPPIAAIISVIVNGNIGLKENSMEYAMEVGEVEKKYDEDIKTIVAMQNKKTSHKKINKIKKEVKKDNNIGG